MSTKLVKAMRTIREDKYGNVKVIQRSDNTLGLTDFQNNIIVPFGKYAWISPFDSGLARVRSHGFYGKILFVFDSEGNTISGEDAINKYVKENKPYAKWGIINEKGEEVLPVEYDEVWNFYGKNRYTTRVVKNGEKWDVFLCELNKELPIPCWVQRHMVYKRCQSHFDNCEVFFRYRDWDENKITILDALEGDPDAYWNID